MTLGYLTSSIILGLKVRGQGHRVTQCKKCSRRSSGRRELCTLSSAHPLAICCNLSRFEPMERFPV